MDNSLQMPIFNSYVESSESRKYDGLEQLIDRLVNQQRPRQTGVERWVSTSNGFFSGSISIYQRVMFNGIISGKIQEIPCTWFPSSDSGKSWEHYIYMSWVGEISTTNSTNIISIISHPKYPNHHSVRFSPPNKPPRARIERRELSWNIIIFLSFHTSERFLNIMMRWWYNGISCDLQPA